MSFKYCTNVTQLRLYCTNVFREFFLLCGIALGNKAHETSWNDTFLGYTPNIWGDQSQSKRYAKHEMITHMFGEYCNDFVKNMFGFSNGFRRISGPKSLLNLHSLWSMCGKFMVPFLNMLAACLESKRETQGDSLTCAVKMRRVINCTKRSQGNQF